MKRFASLYEALDATTRTSEKVAAMARYFGEAPAADAAWAVHFLSGNRPKRLIGVRKLAAPRNLLDDVTASLNATEMAKRQFREIAWVAGLVFPGFPRSGKTARQLQASAGLFFDVFSRFDPGNLLVSQAHREVLERQLESSRLGRTLERLSAARVVITRPRRTPPLAFPLLVDRTRERVSSESLEARVRRMQATLERAADRGAPRSVR